MYLLFDKKLLVYKSILFSIYVLCFTFVLLIKYFSLSTLYLSRILLFLILIKITLVFLPRYTSFYNPRPEFYLFWSHCILSHSELVQGIWLPSSVIKELYLGLCLNCESKLPYCMINRTSYWMKLETDFSL